MKTSAALVKLVIFMVVTSILTLFLAATIGNITLGGKTRYHALFSDVTGLLPGNDVRISGVRVGQIDGVELADRKLAKVTFSVDDAHQLPQSAILRLRYRNLVGERYLAVTEGPGSATPLRADATVPLAQTRNALDLTVLFNGFRPLFQALDPQATNQVAYELVQTLQGEGGTITSLMQRTASLTNTLADRDAVIGRVVTNLSTVLDTLGQGDQLSQLVLQLRRLSAGFAQDRTQIGQSLVGINNLTTATASLLSDVRSPLRNDIAQLGTLAGTLDDNKEVVNGVLQRLPTKLDRIIGTATYGSWFNFYLCGIDAGGVALPTGQKLGQFVNTAPRCQRGSGQ
ncbi:MAG: transporter substrate-binding protein [Frankiales bacterium]|jgi:phospholipid/cholesterol/gamma-HCH transport system substrate-binding protein|nr:transporter substrate-binding protein [Frankiales bacterium]